MGSRAGFRRAKVAAWLEQRRPGVVTEDHFEELRALVAPVSENDLRRLLRQSGAPLAPLVEGVRQEDFDSLERSLTALEDEYRRAVEASDRKRAKACRRLVISAKDRARWSASHAKTEERRVAKTEMAEWMLVWLENPPLFSEWARLRRQASGRGPCGPAY